MGKLIRYPPESNGRGWSGFGGKRKALAVRIRQRLC
jgi:hypothetical protein